MRCGYTTGSCVTAGVKACLLALNGEYPNNVIIKSPQDADIEVPIFNENYKIEVNEFKVNDKIKFTFD